MQHCALFRKELFVPSIAHVRQNVEEHCKRSFRFPPPIQCVGHEPIYQSSCGQARSRASCGVGSVGRKRQAEISACVTRKTADRRARGCSAVEVFPLWRDPIRRNSAFPLSCSSSRDSSHFSRAFSAVPHAFVNRDSSDSQ